MRSRNVPVANAKIFLNGQEIMKTDVNGRYKLKKIKAGTYKLRAEAGKIIIKKQFIGSKNIVSKIFQ